MTFNGQVSFCRYIDKDGYILNKIGLFIKKDSKACAKGKALYEKLTEKGIGVCRMESRLPSKQNPLGRTDFAPDDLDCVFVLGGDGTFLSAVRWIGEKDIPILGVKFGEVGFLAAISEDEMFDAVDAVLENRFVKEARTRLLVTIIRDEDGEKSVIARETVLNDIVITKGALARLAHIKTYINNRYLTTYKADGLILATPTGSTAYSLAAGGPITHPFVSGIIMTPICPFTLTNRPLIVPDSVPIHIQLEKKNTDIMLTLDGQTGYEISEKDTIYIEKSPFPIHMIVMPGHDYFDVLKTKLRWSGGRF